MQIYNAMACNARRLWLIKLPWFNNVNPIVSYVLSYPKLKWGKILQDKGYICTKKKIEFVYHSGVM